MDWWMPNGVAICCFSNLAYQAAFFFIPSKESLQISRQPLHFFSDGAIFMAMCFSGMTIFDLGRIKHNTSETPTLSVYDKDKRLIVKFYRVDSVVINKVSNTIENWTIPVYFDTSKHVTRVPENDVCASIYNGMRKQLVLFRR